jgi:hypothetical protein
MRIIQDPISVSDILQRDRTQRFRIRNRRVVRHSRHFKEFMLRASSNGRQQLVIVNFDPQNLIEIGLGGYQMATNCSRLFPNKM